MKPSSPELDRCDCDVIHRDVVEAVRAEMPPMEEVQDLARFFKVFGDPTRLMIVEALLKQEMCVCDIAVLLDMTKSAISHQLRVLRQERLVKFRKEGKSVYYSLADEHIGEIIETGMVHIRE